jgi:DNA topoisomerase VI subunit B
VCLRGNFEPDMPIGELTKRQIHQITALLRDAKFPKPTGACLSPAGEYNLRLGILKELKPDVVATYSESVSVHNGHPFIVEAAVSLGGAVGKPGINMYRFANRIPLLFEVGNDVSSQIAAKKIRWASYKIKNSDKVGVFVSIVSTKIPFKGTSKEYIGDDNGPLHLAIKHAISQCCVQLKKEVI